MTQADPASRRRFLRGAALGVLAVPVGGLLAPRARSAGKPKLDPSSRQAKALQYVHDASRARDKPGYRDGATCGNCLQWTGGDSQWGGCNIYPNNLVNRDGWCSAWAEA